MSNNTDTCNERIQELKLKLKNRYFRLSNEVYFTILIAIKSMRKTSDFYKKMNLNAELHCMHYKYTIRGTIINDDYLIKMIKCCGNTVFNKKDNKYSVKTQDFLPVFLIFKQFIMEKNQDENLKKVSDFLKKEIMDFDHYEYVDSFTILRDVNEFKKEYNRIDKGFTHFLVYYYSISPPEEPVKKKKIKIVKKTKK